MIYREQSIKHNEGEGEYGDCFRTALACVLDMEPSQVPHFMDGFPDDWAEQMNDWLLSNGFFAVEFAFDGSVEYALKAMGLWSKDTEYLIAGRTIGGTDHQCVGRNDQIIHDPEPRKPGLVGPCSDGFVWITIVGRRI